MKSYKRSYLLPKLLVSLLHFDWLPKRSNVILLIYKKKKERNKIEIQSGL